MKKLFLSTIILMSAIVSFAQKGIFNPGMYYCDTSVTAFLSKYNIPGATFALSKDGKLIYLRSFGYADVAKTELTQPYHKFRIASVSKPITSIAIMKLLEDGLIDLNDKVFGSGGILGSDPDITAATITDSRIYNITVKHLLEHSAGWDRDMNCFPNPTSPYPYQVSGCDPISAPLYIAAKTGTANPVSKKALITFLLEKGLDFSPGTKFAYSNIAYLMLGKIIEQKSGLSYENYLKTKIFNPLGICDFELAQNLKANKKAREGEYTGNGYSALSAYGTGASVPYEYGALNIESMDAHGGWVATASDLVKLIVAVDNFSTKPDILSAATVSKMVLPSVNNINYSNGWSVNAANNWWHSGSLDGTASFIARTQSGYTWAIILNKREIGSLSNDFWNGLDALPWNCIANTTSVPAYDLMLHPTTNASGLTSTAIVSNSVTLNWTKGNGNKRIVVCSKSAPIHSFPLDGKNYVANSSMGLGDDLGKGNYVVYNDVGSTATINNLNPDSVYYFRVFEYNNNVATGSNSLYKLCNCPSIKVEGGLSLNSTTKTQAFKIYPNPVLETLTIEVDNNLSYSVEINNVLGSKMVNLNTIMGKNNIDFTHLPSGVYILKTKDRYNNIIGIHKIIKN